MIQVHFGGKFVKILKDAHNLSERFFIELLVSQIYPPAYYRIMLICRGDVFCTFTLPIWEKML